MEIVKRLEGSEPEEVKYDFEEHYLEENEEENNKRKKGTLFTMLGLMLIAVLGYFGFKSFSTSSTSSVEKHPITNNVIETIVQVEKSIPLPQVKSTQKPDEVKVEKKKTEEIKKEEIKVKRPVLYTEVLAKKLEPKVKEKKKEPLPPTLIVKEEIKTIRVLIPKKEIIKPIVKKQPKTNFNSRKTRVTTVKRGDTLASISRKFYGTSQEFQRIIQENKSIKSHKTSLKIGQKILIPSIYKKYKKKKIEVKKKVKAKKVKAKKIQKIRKVKIKRGDTLALIAQRFYGNSRDFKRIIRANKKIKSSKTRLKAGQEIIVPYLPKNQRRRFVTVKKGYSLAYISKKFYGTTKEMDRIVKANRNIKSKKSTLKIGQKVYVPR